MLIVLGSVAAGFVGFVGLLVGAVTFLGTSAETGSTTIDGTAPSAPSRPPVASPVAASMGAVGAVVQERGWELSGEDLVQPACTPMGWRSDAVDEAERVFTTAAGEPVLGARITAHVGGTDDGVMTQTYLDCEVEQRWEEPGTAGPVGVFPLPPDPQAPGTILLVEEEGSDPRPGYDIDVVVGELAAHLEVCSCAGFADADAVDLARRTAAILADQQGLPRPR